MAGRTLWVQQSRAVDVTAAGITAFDMLSTAVDHAVLSRATVVSIKGRINASFSPSASGFERTSVGLGFIVGPSTVDTVDMPTFLTDVISPGWMWAQRVIGSGVHDGTRVIQQYNADWQVDVKSKRALAAKMGVATLWLVADVDAVSSNGQLRFDGAVLLYVP